MRLGVNPFLKFQVAADAGRAWQLQVYLNDEKVLDKLIEGPAEGQNWQEIDLDLSKYSTQEVVVRLYQRVLIPHHEAGNAYWRHLSIN